VAASLLDLFDRSLTGAPHRPAIVGDTGDTSYADLNAQARQLSRELARSGVVAGDAVGLGPRPDSRSVAALVAVWRLGAVAVFDAYPDPHPRPGAGPLPAGRAAAFVDGRHPSAGLVVSQRAAANQVRWAIRRWALSPDDRVLSAARTPAQWCFEVFLALASGASVIWPPDPDRWALVDSVVDQRATIVPLPVDLADPVAGAAAWRGTAVRLVLQHDVDTLEPTTLRWVADSTIDVWSTYGLARAGSVLAAGRVDADGPDGGPLIGRPVDGVRLALLDDFGEPVPPGVPGRLYLAGDCVPLGMEAEPRAIADRFRPDPFGPPGSRMLCLVDWARWRTGGVLQLLDRPDDDFSGGSERRAERPSPPADQRAMTAWETVVADVWSELLGTTPAGAQEDFYALGGYSLLVPVLADRLHRASGVDVPITELFHAATVAQQAALLQAPPVTVASTVATAPEAVGETDLVADATLDPAIVVPADTRGLVRSGLSRQPRQVLLTGATGFLGAFLLAEILRVWPEATVVCLVRAATAAQGLERVEHAARRYQVWTEAVRDRVVPLTGDLEQPRLGLAAARFDELAGQVDVILHSAARVNLAEPYDRLRTVNVLGTHEVLRLAARRAVPVHLVSTIGVVAGTGDNPEVLEESRRVGPDKVSTNGYLRSKWAADELVRQAGERGLPTAIYRPARISGDALTGAIQSNDAFWVLVRAAIEAGAAPEGPEFTAARVNLVPVDYVARAIVHLCRSREPDGTAYHLTSPVPTPITAVLDRVRAAGYRLAGMPGDEWAERLASAAHRAGPDSALTSAAVLVGRAPQPERLFPPLRYDRTNTERGLTESAIECPPIGPRLLDRYLRFLVESGDWPAPAPSATGIPVLGRRP
jgi:thioester reductase-like protein